ncbi:MBG domain-containing protein [uncultured Aquimarina sp.]|uniref:MBG domain-containing protein n=1 Tax=uncultured Aquimarina sp. TaxID=575652 RepID=UPI00260672E1|nr:MBG domain-containing protein [uncultured Aquimarina sp.]
MVSKSVDSKLMEDKKETLEKDAKTTTAAVFTSLGVGDIAFSSINTDGNDEFSFVLLTDISGTTTIHFTDDGFNSGSGSLLGGEGTVTWTYTGSLSEGTEVSILLPRDSNFTGTSTVGGMETGTTTETGAFSMSSSGDSLIAYTGTVGVPTTYIAAVYIGGLGFTEATTTTTSAIPTGLSIAAFTAMQNGGTSDNYQFDCNQGNITTVSNLRESLFTIGNFVTTTATINYPAPGCNYLAGGCSAPTAQATSASFGTETSSTLTLNSFTAPAGGATGYVIIMTTDNTFTAPTDGALPSANTVYGGGDQVVFAGTSNAGVTVTGLDPNTQYFFRVYSYNDCSGTNTFETTGLSTNDTTALGVLTVTADSGLSKVYGATDPTLTYTITGFQGTDNEGSLDTPVTISRASGENVANYVITPAGASDANYTVSFVTSTFAITQAALTVTADSGLSKVYGATDPTLTYTITGFVNGDVEGDLDTPVSISRASGENVANYVVTPASAADTNYSVSFVTSTFAITQAPLTVTADSGLSKVYGATDPTLTYTITGFVNGDVEGDLDTPVSISRASGENVANYVVTPASAADTNYSVSFVTSTFGITPAALTVTADSGLSKVYGATDPTLTYTITGFVNGDVEGDLDTPVSISRASGENVANYVVTPGSATDTNYSVSFVTSTFAITQAALTVTADSGLSKVYGATDPTLTYTITGFVNGDVEGDLDTPASISRASGENVANYVVTPASAADTNYSVSFVTSTFGITQAALTVTADSGLSKVYGATDPTLTYTITGFVNGDVEGDLDTPVSISRASGENVANYVVTPSGATDTNYSVSFVTSTFGITQAALTVTADSGLSKVYGATDPTLTYTITGFVNGDVEGDLDTPVSISRATGENVANYVVTPGSAADTNYSVSFVTSTFAITQAPLTVTGITGDDKVYDGTTAATVSGTAVLSGIVGVDDVTLGGTPIFTFASPNGGTGIAITTTGYTISGTDSGNYTLTQPTLSADITGQTVAITSTEIGPTGANPIPVTITFSGSVTGFVEGDITVGNGTTSNFSGSGAVYTVDIIPTAAGNVTVDVNANVAVDGGMTGNEAAPQFSIMYDNLLGVDDELLATGVRLYPIPATNSITIHTDTSLRLEKAEIFDIRGKMIISKVLNSTSEVNTIDISSMESGVYLMTVYSENGLLTQRIIKQ